MTDQTPKRMTIAEYAAHTGLADSTIRRRIKRGALEAHQVDGRWIIDGNDRTPKQTPSQTPSDAQPASERIASEVEDPLVAQLQSENAHLREQVDRLTHVVAMQTQSHAELTKQLPPPRSSLFHHLRSAVSRLTGSNQQSHG